MRLLPLLFVFALCAASSPMVASAQSASEQPSARRAVKRGKAEATRSRDKQPRAQDARPAPASTEDKSGAPKRPADADADTEGGDIRKEGDTEVKVLEFSGLDIEGQLKSPQMLYFLNRLRAEFDRPTLPHRSFLPELERTRYDEALR